MNISEVAKLSGLTVETIRYYEELGIITPVPRTANGQRQFDDRSIYQLRFAKNMREAGMGTKVLQQYASLIYEDDDSTIDTRLELLKEQADLMEKKMLEMEKAHKYLTHKVDNYARHLYAVKKWLS